MDKQSKQNFLSFYLPILIFFFAQLFSASLYAQCPPGTLTLLTQAEVNQFAIDYPGCTMINGDLTVGPSTDIDNLNALSSITRINGRLHLLNNQDLTDITGLSNIEVCEEGLIVDNNDLLGSIFLPSLDSVNNLISIKNNEQISGFDFSNVSTREIEILDIRNNDLLSSALLPTDVRTIEQYLRYDLNPMLNNISEMIHLQSIGSFLMLSDLTVNTLPDFDSLLNIGTLSAPGTVPGLFIEQNPNINSISNFALLNYISDRIRIIDNPSLTSFDLAHITTEDMAFMDVRNNASLNSALLPTDVTSLEIYLRYDLNPMLNNISEMIHLQSIGSFLMLSDLSVDTLPTFDSLLTIGLIPAAGVSDGLFIEQNPNINSISNFALLNYISDRIRIIDNPSLTSFDLAHITTEDMAFMDVRNNASLNSALLPTDVTSLEIYLRYDLNPLLNNISEMIHLQSIGSFLMLSDLTVDTLPTFDSLLTIGLIPAAGVSDGLFIEQNPNINSISNFALLNYISDRIRIIDNPSLTSFDLAHITTEDMAFMDVRNNASLNSALLPTDVTSLEIYLRYDLNPMLNNISEMIHLQSIGSFLMLSDLTVDTLPTFDSLLTIGLIPAAGVSDGLFIEQNPNINSISNFALLNYISDRIRIIDNPSLTSFDLAHITTEDMAFMDVRNNASLNSALLPTDVTSLEIYLRYDGNPLLESISEMNDLENIGQFLRIFTTAACKLPQFANLDSIGLDFQIRDNPNLLALPSFNENTFIGRLVEIRNNLQLSYCQVEAVCNFLQGDSTRIISGNLGNCLDEAAILSVCGEDIPRPGGPITALCKDIEIYLDSNGSASITAEDIDNGSSVGCGTGEITIDQSDFSCLHLGPISVILTVSNSSGEEETCTATVMVMDTLSPTPPMPPADQFYTCASELSAPLDLTATDNCGSITVAPTEHITTGACLNDFVMVRTWTFSDAAGNTSSVSQTITVQDTLAPVAPIPPADLNLACAADVPAPIDLTATDNCDGDITVSPVIQITPGACINDFIEVRTWTFTDTCGNSSSVMQTITVSDTLAPVAPTPPADVTVACADEVPAPVDLTATDNCDGDITVSPSAEITPGECANDFVMVRTWTFVDTCGNTSSVSQTITVLDTIKPTWVRPLPPRELIASCGMISPPDILMATDNCDAYVPVVFTEDTIQAGQGFEYDTLCIRRRWTATDSCGNRRRRTQRIYVVDCPDPCNIEGITVGPTITNDSTLRMMGGPICNDDGTYNVEICIQWKGNPMPDFIEIEINGSGGFIQIPIDGPQDYPEKCFTLENLPANGRLVTIFARIGREGCTYRARDLFRAPDRCDPPPTECDITDANVQIAPVCQNGNVSTCIMIEGALLPADASRARAFIGGEVVEITQYTLVPGGAVVCFEGLRADGGNKDFFFMAGPGCSITKRAFLQMPRNCDGDPGDDDDDKCDVTGIRNPVTNCEGNGTYSLTFDVTYNDMPAGQLAVEVGHGANKTWSYHTVTGSPQTITVTGLPAAGGYANVFIKSNDVGGCTWYERSWYRAPDNCGRNRDSNFSTSIDQIRVYPNPSEGKFFLLIEQDNIEMIEVAISNALGQVVKTLKVESNREEVLDLNEMPEGIYTLRIMQGEVPVYRQVQVQR